MGQQKRFINLCFALYFDCVFKSVSLMINYHVPTISIFSMEIMYDHNMNVNISTVFGLLLLLFTFMCSCVASDILMN